MVTEKAKPKAAPKKTAKRADRRQFITDESGRKTAIILPIKEYERLVEDLHDLAAMAERDSEPRLAWEDVKARLRADGILQG